MGRWIADWNPEDEVFWERAGRKIARRNLIFSILAEHLGFCVWMMWSVVATRLRDAGFSYSDDQLFSLIAIPGLVGALMRFPYTFAVPRFGGRNWTVVSALLLLVPITALAALVTRPGTPYWLMALAAATAGLGGGNFASSMANISFFYPDRAKGLALGLNAAGGNVGVSSVQLVVPLAIGAAPLLGAGEAGKPALQNAALVWAPLVVLAALGAVFFMDNLTNAKSSAAAQLGIVRRRHTWLISWLYVGTFGSFVGYSAAFPMLLKTQFPGSPAGLSFVGALVGSLARPLGGKLADRFGGARVTLWNFVVMALVAAVAIELLRQKSFVGFVATFLVLFVTAGIGNGSTYRMVPSVFREENLRGAARGGPGAEALALRAAQRESAAVLGFTSAIGALGGYVVPRTFGLSIRATGSVERALWAFVAFYVTCVAITAVCYRRRKPVEARVPSVAE